MIGKGSSKRPADGWTARTVGAIALALCVAAAHPARAETKPVKIAHQVDRDSGRLMLEFPRAVEYAVERAAPYTFLRFSQPVTGDFATAQRGLGRFLTELRVAGGGRVLVMRAAGPSRMTHRQRGSTITIAWVGRGRPEFAAKPPDAKPPAPKAAEKPPAAPPEPKSAEKTAPPQTEIPAAKPEPPREEAKRPDADAAKPGPNGAQPHGTTETPAPPAVGPVLSVTNDGTETRVAVAWPEPTGAAVFRHGDTVWIVFSRRQPFDLAAHQKELGPAVERLARIEHAEATVLAARIRSGVAARVTHERNVWTVALKQGPAAAADNDLDLAITRGAGEKVSVPLAGAEAPIRLADPESGSTLFAVPSRAVAAAAGEHRFVTFRLRPAVQGAVVEALADGLTIGAEGAAIVIRRDGGLLLSGGPPPVPPTQGQ